MRRDEEIRLAVVDMAGTTVNENGLVEASMRAALKRVGAGPDDFHERFTRARGGSKLAMLTGLLDGDADLADLAHRHFEDELGSGIDAGRVSPIAGAQEVLAELRRLGIKIALATGFGNAVRDRLLERLQWTGLVDVVLSPEDAGRGRPYPDLALTALLRLQVDSVAQVAVVGDTVNDLLAGDRAGASVVAGVLTGAHGREALEAAPHTHLLDDIRQFPAIVRSA